ncbi:MAG: tRNA (N(6)-L-threonylcarbamoyladenosine(37)-C(2))-methylthiotransferase [Candidatus Woesearchaeota archaeon]|nr:MAG: tRNA (N(6)-L-threonylcarbamoyladenosine(37)-C(2))-methylthiotransferase [Candidatus Woesearchaeota archaeon]
MSFVHIKTYGCSFNQLDSQIMAGKLAARGFQIIDDDKGADLILINSCTVKNLSESKFFGDVRRYKEEGKKLLLCGCITQAEENYLQNELKDISVVGVNDLDKVAFIAEQTLKGNPIQFISKLGRKKENEEQRFEKESLRLSSPKIRTSSLIEIIPINEGCLNTCSFCKTKQARGQLFSYSSLAIKAAVQRALESGAKEIYLTSQDTACYGFDIQTSLPSLLKEILTLEGDFRLRIGMGNPNHFKKIIGDILSIMETDDRVYRFLHVPLQAGSDRILDEMRRMYKRRDFEEIVFKAKLRLPDITFANDIIVAYPTETEEEFLQTLAALSKVRTNVLNYSRFWLRPGTPAQSMYKGADFVDGAESKRRSKMIREHFERIGLENNKKWVGWEGEVLISEKGKEGTNTFVGRNLYYKPIILSSEKNVELGQKRKVRIVDASWMDFRGVVLE